MDYSQLPSERKFGLFFAFVFAGLAAFNFYNDSSVWSWIFLLIASFLVTFVAILLPRALSPFNKVWFRLGHFMSLIMNPLVLGIIFFLFLTPFAIIGRLIGRDELRLEKKPVNSYWVDRLPSEPASDSFKNQF
jgi:hypothetical protein